MHLIQRFSISAKENETLYQVLVQADITGLLSSASIVIELPDGSILQDWPSYELLLEKQPSVPNDETSKATGALPTKKTISLNFVSNPAMCRAEVLSVAWKLFFRPNSMVEVWLTSFPLEAPTDMVLEESDRDHLYSWII
jgi:hypothetical protein